MRLLLGVLVLLSAVQLVWAADSPEAQSLTLTPTRGAWGDLALEASWDAYGPELRPGKGWITLGETVRVPAVIERAGTVGALVRSERPFLVRELQEALAPLLCLGQGTLSVKVRDLFCHEVEWEAPPARVSWVQNGLLSAVRAAVCGPESWRTVPGGKSISDIASFLAACPPPDELALLRGDFPILFRPARDSAPGYACTEPTGALEAPSDQLVIYQALRVIRHLLLSTPLPWTYLHPYDWLKSKFGALVVNSGVGFADCHIRVTPPGGTAQVTAIVIQEAELQGGIGWGDPRTGGLARLILRIFHLARHVDRAHDCGERDSSLDYLGAWGVEYTLATMLSQGTIQAGLSSEQRGALAAYAQQLLATRFCSGG